MAARSTHVTLENLAGFLNLRLMSASLDHGVWKDQPPQLIGNRADWESESDGILTGTEGRVTYQIEDVDENRVGELTLTWNNPFVGSNSYTERVTPMTTKATDSGFSVVHTGGGGDNANVRFVLLSGFCQAEGDIIVCSQAMHLAANAALYAGIWEQRQGPSMHARHGLTSDQYQQAFDELVGQGFRPVQVSGYTVAGQDRYAAIFEQRDGPPWAARHGLSAEQYQQAFNELVGQGFRPVQVSGYTVAGQDRYAAIFEQRDGPPWAARHGLSAEQYQQAFNELVGQGFRSVQVSGYTVAGQDRYAAIFEQRDGPPWAARHGLSGEQYQQAFNELRSEGFRLVQVSGYSTTPT